MTDFIPDISPNDPHWPSDPPISTSKWGRSQWGKSKWIEGKIGIRDFAPKDSRVPIINAGNLPGVLLGGNNISQKDDILVNKSEVNVSDINENKEKSILGNQGEVGQQEIILDGSIIRVNKSSIRNMGSRFMR
jgi:ligand-binding sensor protein